AAGGKPADDLLPGPAAVVRAQQVRPEIVEAQGVDGGVGRFHIESSCLEDADLRPGNELLRGDVLPALPSVARAVDQAVVAACPEHAAVLRRRRQRIHHAALLRPGILRSAILSNVGGNLPAAACEIRADLLPGAPAVASLPDGIRGEVERARI